MDLIYLDYNCFQRRLDASVNSEIDMTNSTETLNDTQLRVKALAAPRKERELGVAATLRFLALANQNSTDYVDISRQIYEDRLGGTLIGLAART